MTTTIFGNNPSGVGSAYYIGRPLETTSTITAYNDTITTYEKFTYVNNKISKIEKRGNTTDSKYLVEILNMMFMVMFLRKHFPVRVMILLKLLHLELLSLLMMLHNVL